MRIVNLLHHPVNIVKETGEVIKIKPATRQESRVISFGKPRVVGNCAGVPVIERDKGYAAMSDVRQNTYYIVSTMTARELCHPQFISPNTIDPTQVVKEGGRVIGVKSFQTFRRRQDGAIIEERPVSGTGITRDYS